MLIYRADYNRLWEEVPIMCEHCRNIQIWRKFDAPKDYLACIAYIQQLSLIHISEPTRLC